MLFKYPGALFTIDTARVAMTELAKDRAAYLQRQKGRTKEMEAVHVHSGLLLQLHVTGQHGHIHPDDRRLNRNNIQRNSGRVISVIGSEYPFVIITELPEGDTLITTPEEV